MKFQSDKKSPAQPQKSSSFIAGKENQDTFFSNTAHPGFFSPTVASMAGTNNPNTTSTGGLPTSEAGDQYIGGVRTFGEFLGDVARPVGTGIGNVIGSIAGALTGIKISASATSGPTWSNHGKFRWVVGFNTTGKSGWIVQKIKNKYRAEDSSGNPLPSGPTPEYWEAWAVDASGNVTPGSASSGHDLWGRPDRGTGSKGHWSMTGKVYFTTTDPATKGFTTSSVPDANGLLASTSNPGGLGIARLHRYAQGTWDSTGASPVHTGSAR